MKNMFVMSPSSLTRQMLEWGQTTTLTHQELENLIEFEQTNFTRSAIVIGKAGAGKDTVGEILRDRYGHTSESAAYILKRMAEVIFAVYEKDRVLLQGFNRFRRLVPSCYVDNVWRRIAWRRTLRGRTTSVSTFASPDQTVSWIQRELFPKSQVSDSDIESILQEIYDERYGDGRKWWSRFTPVVLKEPFEPLQHVVLTDTRFPNELFLGWGIGAVVVRIECDEPIRIQRLMLRDGHVDPSRLNHETEQALDHVFTSPQYEPVTIFHIDNNGPMTDLHEQVYKLPIKRVA